MMKIEDSRYLEDEEEIILTGKTLRQHRNICRSEGYKQALEEVLNLPIKDFVGDYLPQIEKLKKDFKGFD